MHTVLRRPAIHRIDTTRRVTVRNVTTPPRVVRTERPIARRAPQREIPRVAYAPLETVAPDPYVDYGRFLTPEGGILLVYKDLDQRLRHVLWRWFAWTLFTGFEEWLLFCHSPVHSLWMNGGLLFLMAVVNWLIVRNPVELYRNIEIRPDCMIIDCVDIFWIRNMEGGWPVLRKDSEGNLQLCGVYGTRYVEYLTVRRFDELDRMPEVFASHLQNAMAQLWANPY